jgi:hypothetical protein
MALSSADAASHFVQWDNEAQTIIYAALYGAWGWEKLHNAFVVIRQLADTTEQAYSLIIDFTALTDFTGNAFLSNSRKLMDNVHPRFTGQMAVVSAPELMQELDNAVRVASPMQFNRLRVYFVDCIDDARAMLQRKSAY